ncbi:chromosome partitioning protein [Nocardia tenerifensis]|uniref:Chromosome partitioning protein n=1 Tax=Nocardia tenerifensis TaxID=228006 RepID=A0A318K9R7_9NOCA|nr:AAA family ATPase [Nocardia tenerifensis]PXX52284.1 chromosome partitioning protein [Nocardia tenerifensis]
MADAEVIAIANQKGGVGKTTATICLGRSAVRDYGARVLVVDMDPQGNTTGSLIRTPIPAGQVRLADAITPDTDVTLREVIVPSIWDGLDVAPGGHTLSVAERKVIAAEYGREHRLREAIAPVLGDYDLILIDNPPTLGLMLINSLVAARKTMLVTEADKWSADGLALLGKTIVNVRNYHNPHLEILGAVVNGWRGTASDKRNADEISQGMAKHFPGVPLWMEYRIPLWTGIKDNIDNGVALDQAKEAKIRVLAADVIRPLAGLMLGRTTV